MSSDKFKLEFPEFVFNLDFSLGSETYFFFYLPHRISYFTILGQKIELDNAQTSKSSFFQYLSKFRPQMADLGSLGAASDPKPEYSCAHSQAYKVKLLPSVVKAGISDYLEEPLSIFVLSRADCEKASFNLRDLVPAISFQLVLVLLSSYLRDILFSFLNNKKLLDMVQFDATPKTENFQQLKGFFKSTSCFLIRSFYRPSDPFASNKRVKRWFIRDHGSQFDGSAMFSRDRDLWESEVAANYNRKFPAPVLARFGCRYNYTVPEYLVSSSFAFLCLFACLATLVRLVRPKKEIHCWFLIQRFASQALGLFQRVFLRTALLVYFYNLIAFCSMITQVKSPFFTPFDFALLSIRSMLLVYPLLTMLEELEIGKELGESGPRASAQSAKSKALIRDIDVKFYDYKATGIWVKIKHLILVFFKISKVKTTFRNDKKVVKEICTSKWHKAKLKIGKKKRPKKPATKGNFRVNCRLHSGLGQNLQLSEEYCVIYDTVFFQLEIGQCGQAAARDPNGVRFFFGVFAEFVKKEFLGCSDARNVPGIVLCHLQVAPAELA